MLWIIGLGAVALCSSALAAPGMPCERWEYARLKDSSRSELVDGYCIAMSKAKLNEDLRNISKELFDKQIETGNIRGAEATRLEMAAKGDAQVGCLRAAEDSYRMLEKRFKLKAEPTCK